MTVAAALAVLVLFDGLLAGFRAAAGRSGRLDKRSYYRHAMTRALGWSVGIVLVHVGLVAALCLTAASPVATWERFLVAGAMLVRVFGAFATVVLLAFAFYFAPVADLRLLTNVLVFGPLTLARKAVVVAGLGLAVGAAPGVRVAIVAVSAAVATLGLESLLGHRYRDGWRSLVRCDR